MFYNGTWGPVCGDSYWDFTDANIVCRQLGFPGALVTARTSQSRRRASGQREMWFRSRRCEGNETDLTNCYHDGWSSYCSYRKEAYVTCITGDEFCFVFAWNDAYEEIIGTTQYIVTRYICCQETNIFCDRSITTQQFINHTSYTAVVHYDHVHLTVDQNGKGKQLQVRKVFVI